MKLLTNSIRDRLVQNGQLQAAVKGAPRELDFLPVVKLFTLDGVAAWLLTEIDPCGYQKPHSG